MSSLVDLLRENARTHGPQSAIVFQGRTTTHATFDQVTDCVAAGLASRGIAPGDRVGLYCINSDFFALAYFGILKAGATVVPINLLLNPKEVAYILRDAGAKALIYHEAFAEAVKEVRVQGSAFRFGVCIGMMNPLGDIPWSDLLTSPRPFVPPSISASSLAALLYTAGTTGVPKGAMLSHANLAANVASIGEALKLQPGHDVLLVVLPMFHAFAATVGMLYPLLHGCTLVPLPKFDPIQVAEAVAKYHVTVLPMVPSMYSVLLRLPDEAVAKFASLKYGLSGGAALPGAVMEAFEQKFGKLIYEGDGPTECSPCTCVNPVGGRRKPQSVGLCVPGVAMRILNDDGREKPDGEIGEICVRGPNVMQGYWNHPDETAAAFFGEWFRTGDLGTRDADGYFFIVDRKKDLIIVNGMNVYPRIIEECLLRHPAVREAAVVGEADELHGEIPVAHVALKDGAAADAGALRNWCREHLGRHEIPRKFLLTAALPRNAAGKILKRELRRAGERERGVDVQGQA
jgi:long-chain acyl-CoA synthetase